MTLYMDNGMIHFTIHGGWVLAGFMVGFIYYAGAILTIEKNPLKWPACMFGHTIDYSASSFDENEDIKKWIRDNIRFSKYTVYRPFGSIYKFLYKTDAVAFKLMWIK